MHGDDERTTALVSTRTSFEAEVIAQALRERGVDATVVPTPQLPLNPTQAARVLVLESDLDDARRALEDIKSESSRINWEEVEFDEPDEHSARAIRRVTNKQNRLVMTIGVVLLPIGLAVMMYGSVYVNPMIQTIGGTVLVAALVLLGKGLFFGSD